MSGELALEGGTPIRTSPFPAGAPQPPSDDDDPLSAFERELAARAGDARIAIACSGHDEALALAILASGVDDGEVVVPALHAGAVARALLTAGLRVVPAEVEQQTANLSTRGLANAVSARTRALVVTHAFGHPAQMPELLRLAEHHDLAVIEDASDALGAGYDGRCVGDFGAVAVFGFAAGHLLTAGEGGGAVLVGDAEVAARLRARRAEQGWEMPEQAVRVALAELRDAEPSLHARRQAAWHLTYELRAERTLAPMHHGRRIRHGYDAYVCRIRSMLWERSIDETVEALRAEGIPCRVAAGPSLHEDVDVRAALGGDDPRLEAANFDIAARLSREMIAVPLCAATTTTDMNDVAAALRKVAAQSAREST